MTVTSSSLLLILFLFVGTAATAQNFGPPPPEVFAKPTIGPPTSTVYISGSGFDPFAAVDIYFDNADLAFAVTNGNGSFGIASPTPQPTLGGIPIVVPKDALPGTHWVSAIERYGIKAAQRPFLVRTDWAQFHFSPDHQGVNPYENVLGPDTVPKLVNRWQFTNGWYDPWDGSPAVVNGVVYANTWRGHVHALNADTGAVIWNTNLAYGCHATPSVANGVVYVGSGYGGGVYALSANTGAILWQTPAGWCAGTTAVANGMVYVGSYDNNVYALDANTGAIVWKYATGGYVHCCSFPAVAKGVVYIGSADKNLYALNARTGALIWKYGIDASNSSPAVANGVVYVGSSDHYLYALDASTGALLWTYETGAVIETSPAVGNGVVYIASDYSDLYALNASTGALIWKYTKTPSYWGWGPTVTNGVVYMGTGDGDTKLYALDANTGALLWTYDTGYPVWTSPPVVNGMLYFGSMDGATMYAFGMPTEQDKLSPPARPDPSLLTPDWSLQPITPVNHLN